MVEVSPGTDIADTKKGSLAAHCFMVPVASAGETPLDLRVATFIDRAFHFYVAYPSRCPCCLQYIDQSFALWNDRAAVLGLPLGLVYMSLCDGAYFKTLDVHFRRRNGWARKTISAALALWPMRPLLKGSLCKQLSAPGLQGPQSVAPNSRLAAFQEPSFSSQRRSI